MEDNISLEKRILSSNEWGLVAMLHEGLLENFKASMDAIKVKDYGKLNTLSNKSRDILTELIVVFRENDQVSTDTRELYLYANELITKGEIKKDIGQFEAAIRVITPLWEGFKSLEEREEPQIVTGLTYGKKDLDEHTKVEGKTFQG
ncbi:MAG: flagellar protein FliS [Tissierellaceae bacterium]|nr:flagellar protein FliS [Tissierellaceae bacterium]